MWVKWRIELSTCLVAGISGLLLIVNVLIGPMLVAECLRGRSWAYTFVIFINSTEDEIYGNIRKFADDTKVFCKVGSNDNCAKLRADLRKLYIGQKIGKYYSTSISVRYVTLATTTQIILFF